MRTHYRTFFFFQRTQALHTDQEGMGRTEGITFANPRFSGPRAVCTSAVRVWVVGCKSRLPQAMRQALGRPEHRLKTFHSPGPSHTRVGTPGQNHPRAFSQHTHHDVLMASMAARSPAAATGGGGGAGGSVRPHDPETDHVPSEVP